MKKIISALCLLVICGTAFGQAKNLIVRNATSCTVYYIIQCSDPSAPCVINANSSIIAVPPGSYSYAYNTIPGLPPMSRYILGAKLLQAPISCPPTPTFAIGEPCTGWPLMVGMAWYTPSCNYCGQGNAQWVPAPGLGATATMAFF